MQIQPTATATCSLTGLPTGGFAADDTAGLKAVVAKRGAASSVSQPMSRARDSPPVRPLPRALHRHG